jgi:hypothetical protein
MEINLKNKNEMKTNQIKRDNKASNPLEEALEAPGGCYTNKIK